MIITNIMQRYQGVKILFFKKRIKIQKPKGLDIHGNLDAYIAISEYFTHRFNERTAKKK